MSGAGAARRPLILAHRGDTAAAPDNSLPAFRALTGLGVDGVEFDVRVTADEVPLVTHDGTLLGRRLEALTHETIRELQGPGLDEADRIPTLEEALDAIPTGMLLNLELKSSRVGPVVAAAIERIRDRFPLTVTSFHAEPLLELAGTVADLRLGLVSSLPVADLAGQLRSLPLQAASLHQRLLERSLLDELRELGLDIYAWTVNTRADLERAAALGVDALITDDPRQALAVLD